MFQVPLAGQALSSANIGINTTIEATNGSVGNLSVTNCTIGSLKTTIFEPNAVTTNTINSVNAVFDTLVVNNAISNLDVLTLNVSQSNVSNISAQEITCNNLQPLLTAGTNVSILNGVISAINEALLPADLNVSSVDSDVITTLFIDANNMSVDNLSIDQKLSVVNASVTGNMSVIGNITASNLSTGSLKFGAGLLYDSFDKELEVEVNHFVQEGSNLPVTSWAVYKSLNNQFSNIQTQWCYNLSESEFILGTSQVAITQDLIVFYVDFYPQYENSKIIVEFCYSYTVAGYGSDSITTYIQVGQNNNTSNQTIQMLFQNWNDDTGGGTRSGASGSIMGSYTNSDTIGKYHRAKMRIANNSNDLWQLDSTSYPVVKITEFIEIAGVSNPNIRIGSGNISCGNLSVDNITVTEFFTDNLNTTYGVNNGGDQLTIGFPYSGDIVAKSTIRMAGGSAVLNSGDLTWDGTTFNLSTRQSNKNFLVSFGQQDYFSVNSSNTSCRNLNVSGNLRVNGNLEVTGTYNIQEALNIDGVLTADGGIFLAPSMFEDNVSMHKRLNVSNTSVTNGLWVGGNVSVRGLVRLYGNLSSDGNISAVSITATNLSTASMRAGANITIEDGVINAFIDGGSDADIGSLIVDNDANIFGILNVSMTSIFRESLNVCNTLYVGKAGQHGGSVVLYSQTIGNNWATKYDGTVVNMSALGSTSEVNTWFGDTKVLSITPTGVNISGLLKADFFDAQINFASVQNLSVAQELEAYHITVNTSINTCGINCSRFTLIDTRGDGGLNVCGVAYFDSLFACKNCYFETNDVYFGIPAGTGTNARINFLSQSVPYEIGLRFGIDSDDIVRLNIPSFGGLSTYNILMGSISTMTMTNTSTTFHQPVYFQNICVSETTSSILNVTQVNGINGHFTSSLTAANISTGSLKFGDGLLYFDGELSVDFTTADVAVAALGQELASNVCTLDLVAGLGAIDVLTVNTFMNTVLANISVVNCSDIDSNSGTIDVLDCTNLSAVNISADIITGLTMNVNTSINTCHMNCSTLTLRDTGGAGGLNVCGVAYFGAMFCYGGTQFETDNVYFGKPESTGTNARINFWSQSVPYEVGLRFGIDSDDIVRMIIPSAGGSTTYNMLIGNVSTMTMTNTSTRFHQPVNMCVLNVSNISGTNASFTSLTAPNVQPTLIAGTGITFVGNTINSTGTTYSAGNNIQIVDTVVSTLANINVSSISSLQLDVNTSINARHFNGSSLTLTGIGSTSMNVSGTAYIDSVVCFSPCEFQTDNIYVGKPSGTGLESSLNLWSHSTANQLEAKIGIGSDNALRISMPDYGQFANFNIQIKNVSLVTMNNTSARFQRPVIFGSDVTATKITSTNICSTNISLTNCTYTTLRGTNLNGVTVNCSNINVSLKLSVTNISATNGSFTSLTAPNVQPTLTAGTGITIVGNTINSLGTNYVAGTGINISGDIISATGAIFTAGNNIEIVSDVISTSSNINVSSLYSSQNICGNNGSFVNLSCLYITASNVQPLITDNSLTISNTSGLQTALDAKQDFILDGGLAMIKVNGLLSALSGKQNLIGVSSLIISNTSGLQASLNSKQATLSVGNNIQLVGNVISTLANINVSSVSTLQLDVNSSINTCHLNCSTLTLTDTGGAGGLNVCGVAYFDAMFCYGGTQFETDNVYFGKPESTGTNARINFWSQSVPYEVGLRFGVDSDDIVRMNIPSTGGSTTYNMLMGNVSTMTMDNTSTTFHQPVNMSGLLTIANISATSAVTIIKTLIHNPFANAMCIAHSNFTSNTDYAINQYSGGTTSLNAPTGTNIVLRNGGNQVATVGIDGYSSNKLINCSNISNNNFSGENITATSIIAPNVQPTLIAGTGITIVGNTISSTGGGTSYTAGNNIEIVSDVISTSSNINVSSISTLQLDVNTSINARHLNCSTLKLTDTIGATGLNVSGVAYIDSLICYGTSEFQTDNIYVGKPSGTGLESALNLWSHSTPNQVEAKIGIGSDNALRISMPDYGQFANFNIQIKNVSLVTMNNTSARFQRPVIFGSDVTATKITSTNICNTNMSITNCTISTLRGTNLNGVTVNCSNINVSLKLTVTNISATNGTFTSLTAPNVQEKLISGNNIQLVGNVLSTTSNINVSNISSINGSFTNLTCSGNISFPIGNLLYRNPFDGILNVSELNISNTLLGPLATSFKSQVVNTPKLNVSNISLVVGLGGGVLDMGGLGQITNLGILTGMTLNTSQTNSSNISAISITATELSLVDLTVSGTIDRKNNIIRRYRNGNETLISSSYQVRYGVEQYINDDLLTTSVTENTFTIVKPGRYKISTNIMFDNGTYTDRVNWRITCFKNDSNDTSLGQSFCYTRHRDYATYGSAYHSTIQDFVVDDTFYYIVDCNRALATGFTSSMAGQTILSGTYIEIEYLGA